MAAEVKCPWCDAKVVLKAGYFNTQYGEVKEGRCPNCNQLVMTRLGGIPDDIIKKGD